METTDALLGVTLLTFALVLVWLEYSSSRSGERVGTLAYFLPPGAFPVCFPAVTVGNQVSRTRIRRRMPTLSTGVRPTQVSAGS